MIEVLRIPISKERLKAMPTEERAFLLLLGYGANQLSMLQKLTMLSANLESKSEFEKTISASQTQMLLRLTIGVLHETWLLIDRHFNKSKMAIMYRERLDTDGRHALAELKRQLGRSSVLSSIRNDFAFHYPKIKDVDAGFDSACSDAGLDDLWDFYFSKFGFNSFFMASELMIIHGIGRRIGVADLPMAQRAIMSEVVSAVRHVFEFTKAFVAAAWLEHFGADMLCDSTIKIEGAPHLNSLWIPFFVEMEGNPYQSVDGAQK
jgi:hypothetical protein